MLSTIYGFLIRNILSFVSQGLASFTVKHGNGSIGIHQGNDDGFHLG